MFLPEDWLTIAPIDVEFKHYKIMAYIQKLTTDFKDTILFPNLNELFLHIDNLHLFLENKKRIETDHRDIASFDLTKHLIKYESKIKDMNLDIIADIANENLPLLKEIYTTGIKIKQEISNDLTIKIKTFGINKREGSIFFLTKDLIKRYNYYMFNNKLNIFFINEQSISSIITEDNLINYIDVDCGDFPFEEAILPIAKEKIHRILLALN